MTFCWMYEKDLLASGIPAGRIYKVGFAFFGKDVLVKENAQAHGTCLGISLRVTDLQLSVCNERISASYSKT